MFPDYTSQSYEQGPVYSYFDQERWSTCHKLNPHDCMCVG